MRICMTWALRELHNHAKQSKTEYPSQKQSQHITTSSICNISITFYNYDIPKPIVISKRIQQNHHPQPRLPWNGVPHAPARSDAPRRGRTRRTKSCSRPPGAGPRRTAGANGAAHHGDSRLKILDKTAKQRYELNPRIQQSCWIIMDFCMEIWWIWWCSSEVMFAKFSH